METKLWSALIGLSKTVDSNPKTEHTDTIITDCIQHLRNHTVTQDLIDLVHEEKDKISPSCKTCTHPCGNTSDYDMDLINDKKKELMHQILNLSDIHSIYRGLCYLGFDIDDSYIDEFIEESKRNEKKKNSL